jgi:hypothetical protein
LSSGTPFRVFRLDAVGLRARLASEEITSPTDLRSLAAISLAALKTSSSITRVVRIGVLLGIVSSNIIHQMLQSGDEILGRLESVSYYL